MHCLGFLDIILPVCTGCVPFIVQPRSKKLRTKFSVIICTFSKSAEAKQAHQGNAVPHNTKREFHLFYLTLTAKALYCFPLNFHIECIFTKNKYCGFTAVTIYLDVVLKDLCGFRMYQSVSTTGY